MNKWYEFKNLETDTPELYIYDEIGGWGITAKEFIDDLKTVKDKDILLYINSPGGSVTEGNAIYNALLRHKGFIVAYVDGIAASMASIIVMACNKIVIAENSFLMIHNPAVGAWGGSDELKKLADVLDKMKKNAITAYKKKSNLSRKKISELMDAETWITANEAIEWGFADETMEGAEAVAQVTVLSYDIPENAQRFFKQKKEVEDVSNDTDHKTTAANQAGSENENSEDIEKGDDETASKIRESSGEEKEIEKSDEDITLASLFAEAGLKIEKLEKTINRNDALLKTMQSERDIALSQVDDLTKALTEKEQTIDAIRKGGFAFTADEKFSTWKEAENELGYVRARKEYPNLYANYMENNVKKKK